MGLCITVGPLSDLAANDPDILDDARAEFDAINDVLRRHGMPEHQEPLSLPRLDCRAGVEGFPYSFLHHLRRFYATYVSKPGVVPPPLSEDERQLHDPFENKVASPRHHLLWHSDCEGFYIPIDFPEVVEDEKLSGGGFGSSQRLMKELLLIASPLGIGLEGGHLSDKEAAAMAREEDGSGSYWIERLVWLCLFEAARLSIEHRAAIAFG